MGYVDKGPPRVVVVGGCRVDVRCVSHAGGVHPELLLDLHIADVHIGGGPTRLVSTPGVSRARSGLGARGSLAGGHGGG